MKKIFLSGFFIICVLAAPIALAREKADEIPTDKQDYFFLLRLAQTLGHERVEDSLYTILQKTRRSPSYPIAFRRLDPEDRIFLESLAESVNDTIVKERLLQILKKIPAR